MTAPGRAGGRPAFVPLDDDTLAPLCSWHDGVIPGSAADLMGRMACEIRERRQRDDVDSALMHARCLATERDQERARAETAEARVARLEHDCDLLRGELEQRITREQELLAALEDMRGRAKRELPGYDFGKRCRTPRCIYDNGHGGACRER